MTKRLKCINLDLSKLIIPDNIITFATIFLNINYI